MKIIVTDRESIEQGLVVRGSYILISIRDPDKRPVRFHRPSALVDVLELAFHDADPAGGGSCPRLVLMNDGHAQQIARFIQTYRDSTEHLVVHCEQGMSRSPAVAAAIARYLKQSDKKFWQEYQPNRYVYETALEHFDTEG